jgi:hypothetical protein
LDRAGCWRLGEEEVGIRKVGMQEEEGGEWERWEMIAFGVGGGV